MDRAVTESTSPQLIDLHIVTKWIRRRRGLALAIVLAGMALTVWLSLNSPTLYKATATLWIERKNLDLVNIAASASLSRDTLLKTGELMNIKPGPTGAPNLPGGFEKETENQLLRLMVSAAEPELAAQLANAWAQATQEAVIARAQGFADQNRAGVEQQLAAMKQTLEEKQKALFEFERDAGVNSSDKLEAHPAALRLNELTRAFTAKQTELAGLLAEQRILEDEKLTALELQDVPRAAKNSSLQRQLQDLEDRRARLRAANAKLPPQTQEVQTLEKEIAAIQQEVRSVAKSLALRLKADASVLNEELEQLKKQLAAAELVMKDLRAKAAQHKLLSSEEELARNAYEKLAFTRNELARGDRYDSSVRLWERAEKPLMPSKTPRWELNLLLGLIMSLVFALGGVIVAELLDDTIRSAPEMKNKLGVNALAIIPDAGTTGARYDAALKLSGSSVARGLHNLQVALEVSAGLGAPGSHSVLTVTAPKTSSGASFTAANLAAFFAAEGRKVLLIDGDLHAGGVSKGLNCSAPQGLAEALAAGKASAEQIKRCGNFDVLPQSQNQSAAVLDPVRAAQLLDSVKSNYDIVIVDAGALSSANALAFASNSSAALVIARSAYTRTGELERALAQLNEARAAKVLVALNRVDDNEARAAGLV